MTILYAWAKPANAIGSWADHTWVTTFDNRITAHSSLGDVAKAGEHLWMCWGSFHPTGGASGHPDGLLGSTDGRVPFACCLVKDNADSVRVSPARGTVQRYGIDGVCHQVANQALFATGNGKAPLTVESSRGYIKSVYVYFQYGRPRAAWAAKIRTCTERTESDRDKAPMLHDEDDFIVRAKAELRDRSDLLAKLLAMRHRYQIQLEALSPRVELSPQEIDAQHQQHMDEVVELIGRERFMAIFDYDPAEEMNLVDPDIFIASRGGRPTEV